MVACMGGSDGVDRVPGGGAPAASGGREGAVHAPWASDRTASLRETFWHDMCREILTTLSIEGLRRSEAASGMTLPTGQSLVSASVPAPGPELFDGRMAILTHGGERIPIGRVHPMLACGITSDPAARTISRAVECSIFQVRTPAGELYTLPLHEIRAFHALTPELMEQIEAAGRRQHRGREGGEDVPFGFEAYTSMARAERERREDEDPYYPSDG